MRAASRLVRCGAWVALALAGCEGDGAAPSPPTAPAPPPPPPPPEPPAVPTGLRVAAIGEDFIEWRWNPVEGAAFYAIQISSDEAWTEEDPIWFGPDPEFRAGDLAPETRRYVRVAAGVGTLAEPVLSAWTTHVTGQAAPASPAVPTGLHVSRSGVDFIAWSWDPVERATGYAVQVRGNEAFTDEDPIHRTAESSFWVSDLDPETALYVRVAAVRETADALLQSAWTTTVMGATATRPPPPSAADCSRIALYATREDFDRRGVFSTARITLEGPPGVGLRFVEPYWDDRLTDRDDPPELPLDLSDIPPVTLAIPSSLPYRELSGGGHRQQISLAWYGDLEVVAVAPGCGPIRLRCTAETILTRGCRP